jgi:hypothetical protein
LGGVLTALIVDLLSAIWVHPEQTKTCTMVVASTSVERDHFISIEQFGQCGGSNCSKDLLSLSTIACRFSMSLLSSF